MAVDLRQLLIAKQKALAAGLEAGREVFEHPGAKGDVAEFDWRGALSEFLPRRYAVSNAFILDSQGEVSDQIDIVIHDAHYCPLLFERGEQRYIPAESVYAVFEVKQELASGTVRYAIEKAASVRDLHRTSLPIVHAGGEYTAREPFDILAGILALRSSWSPPFGDPFEAALGGGNGRGRLDLGCAVVHGAFDVRHTNGGREITTSEPEASLMFFLLHLFGRLQQLGTVPAVDLAEYARDLEANERAGAGEPERC
jgi:hypothetical protein